VLDDAVVRENSIIGSGALVSPGKEVPSGKLVLGIPGKVVGDLTPQDMENSEKEWTTFA
jgi:carbonic anhydrase/acetyltransferase-like protein (isoleucine patch superfamily)